jgi:glucosamine kinase
MILIADSGSTKTHWQLLKPDNRTASYYTKGLNPYFAGEDIFKKVLENDLKVHKSEISHLHFYGSGCGTESSVAFVKKMLKEQFPSAQIDVYSDLFGAARALFGHDSGIACILGTGSVSCVYDGNKITDRVPSLGFILGDEGGGATLGKELLRAYFYKKLPENIHSAFESNYSISREEVLDKIYHKPSPNAYLASFSKFLKTNFKDPYIHDLVYRCFKNFFTDHVAVYPNFKKLPLAFTGSVSSNLKEILAEVAEEFGTTVSKIMKEPMDGLVDFHKGTEI